MIRVLTTAGGLFVALCLTLSGCDTGDESPSPTTDFPLVGTWTDNYGGTVTISQETWNDGYSEMAIVSFDASERWVVLRSPEDDLYTPNQYAKTVWMSDGADRVYACIVVYGLDTLDAAESAAGTSDGSDPESGGCGGFPWTVLTAATTGP